ncbi:hypothetical protein C2G38_2177033 [Gigaspora rosea]|uniref:Uncharacterized protein n=1 Tax=Gigaspora rosea TaxID=44941 RepID=A0A397VIV7_9GLOM|nr:hypothetical protein C2G38_2177033 [Gigaspora rosea]
MPKSHCEAQKQRRNHTSESFQKRQTKAMKNNNIEDSKNKDSKSEDTKRKLQNNGTETIITAAKKKAPQKRPDKIVLVKAPITTTQNDLSSEAKPERKN